MGTWWKVNQWELDQQTAGYLSQIEEYGSLLKSGNKKEARKLYSDFTDTMKLDAQIIGRAVRETNDYQVALEGVKKSKQATIKQTTGFSAALKNLGNVAKSVGASLLTGIATAAIGYGISKLIEFVDHQVNAAKYAKEALQEVSAEWDELTEKQKTAGDLVSKYEADYDRLSKGVNMITGENLSLSDDEYELFKKINSELADSALSSVKGITVAYDAQGNAIVRLSDQMDGLSDAYKQLEQQTRNEIVINGLPKVLENTQKVLSPTWYAEEVTLDEATAIIGKLREIVNSSDTWEDARRQYNIYTASGGRIDTQTVLQGMGYNDIEEFWQKTIQQGESFEPEAAGYLRHREAELATTLQPVREAMRSIIEGALSEDVPAELRNLASAYVAALPSSYFEKVQYATLIDDATDFGIQLSDKILHQSIDNLHELQVDFAKGDINYGEYITEAQRQLAAFMTDEWPEEFQQLLQESYGLDDVSVYAKASRRLKEIIVDFSEEWLNSLTSDQLNYAMSVDNTASMSTVRFMDLYSRNQQSEQYSAKNVATSYAAIAEAQAVMDEAIKAQGHSASITAEQYEKLVAAGQEYAACVRNVNGYMQIDIQAAQTLTASKQAETKATIEAGLAYKKLEYSQNAKDLATYRDILEKTGDLTEESKKGLEDKIKILEKEQISIRSDIDAYNRLGSELEYATSSYKKWLDVQEAPEAGDAYDNMLVAMEQLQEGLKSGKIGTIRFKASAELLVPEGEDVQAYMAKLGRYLTENADGLGHFIDDMFAKGFLSKDSSGRYSFMQGVTVEEIAKGLGLTDELTQYMLQALQDYGWDVNILNNDYLIDNLLKQYDEITATIKEKQAALDELIAEGASGEVIRVAQQELNTLVQEQGVVDAQIKVAATGEMSLEEQLQAEIQRWQDAIAELEAINVPVAGVITSYTEGPEVNDPSEYVSALGALIAYYSEGSEINDPEEFISDLSAVIARYTPGDDDPNRLVSDLGAIVTDYISQPGGKDPNDLVAALTAYIQHYKNAPNVDPSDELVSDLEVTATVTAEAETKDAEAELQQVAADRTATITVAVQDEQGNAISPSTFVSQDVFAQKYRAVREAMIQTEGDLEAALEQAQATITELVIYHQRKVANWGWNPEIITEDYVKRLAQSDYQQDTAIEREPDPVEVPIEPIIPEEPVTLPVEIDTSAAMSAIDWVVAYANSKQATIQYNAEYTGPSYATGTKNAREEDAMVGEKGIETVISDGRFYTVGHNGPEIVHLEAGDQVLTNAETKKLFKGTPRKTGRAYAAGRFLHDVYMVEFGGSSVAATGKVTTGGGKPILPTKTSSSQSSGPNYDSILKALEKLHDWIERALAVAQKKTQNLIDNVKDFVGYIAQNKQVDKALQATRDEITLNQQAYTRYMQQAADVQKQLKLTDDIVQKIHEGTIDIESYDETTKKRISEYQEWYDKAEATLDTIEELKDQERELQLQRLDNILDDYNNRLDQLDDESARVQREIELQKAIGAEVQEKSYNKLIDNERKQVVTLQRERAALEAEFNALVASGVLQADSEDWHKYRNELEGIDEAIHDATISMSEFVDEIYNLRLDKLQTIAGTLQNIQASTEGIISLHDAQGAKNIQAYYDTLISNGHDQIANLEDQNELIREQMNGLDTGSEKYQELLADLRNNERAINDIKVSQEQWNDAIADLSIADLEDQRKALEKTNEQYQKQLEYEEALEALAKAKNQRTKLLYVEGQGFQYVADQDAINEAQKRVDDLEHQAKLDELDDRIEAIEDAKADDNVWSYDGMTILKQNGTMPDVVAEAIQEMLSAALLPDNYTQTKHFEATSTAAGSAGAPTISIGDIHVSGVDNAEALAKDIVQNLPNAILQEWHKR